MTGERGWRSGESARLPLMYPRFDSRTRRHLLVLYSAARGFSPGAPVFPSPQKPTFNLVWFDIFELFDLMIWFDFFRLQSPQLLLLEHSCSAGMNRLATRLTFVLTSRNTLTAFISPHAQYTRLKYSAMAGDHLVSFTDFEIIRVSFHGEHLDNLGEPKSCGKAAPPRSRLSACVPKILLVFPKFY